MKSFVVVHCDEHVRVETSDFPDHENGGGANHLYSFTQDGKPICGHILFQKGPVKEHGVNGIQHVHLLKVIEHRLVAFQNGPYASAYNEAMLEHIRSAIALDGERTRLRSEAGVEGTSQKAEGVETT